MNVNKINPKILYWLAAALVLGYASIKFPPEIAYLNAQQELMVKIDEILRTRATQLSLLKVEDSQPHELCYATESKKEISEVIEALRGVQKKILTERVKIDRLVLELAFEDGSRAHFTIFRRPYDLSHAHLENFTYENSDTNQQIESDTQLTFPQLGTWIETILARNNCM